MPGSAEQVAPHLRQAARADGLTLQGDAMSLAELDGLLSAWRGDGVDRPWLVAEVGAYLAVVLAADVAGARVSDTGSVVLADGAEIDTAAVAARRLARANADLRGVVRQVHARPVVRGRWWRRRPPAPVDL